MGEIWFPKGPWRRGGPPCPADYPAGGYLGDPPAHPPPINHPQNPPLVPLPSLYPNSLLPSSPWGQNHTFSVVTIIPPLSSATTLFCHKFIFVYMNIAFDKYSLHLHFQCPAQGQQGFQVVFQSRAKKPVLPTPQEDPSFMWQVQLVLHNFGVDLRPFWREKNWVDLKPTKRSL